MSWSNPLSFKTVRGAVCLLLCAAILAAICLPVLRRSTQTLENPIPTQPIREITVFEGGEGTSTEEGLPLGGTGTASSGAASGSEATDAAPPQEEDPQTPQPEDTPTQPETETPETPSDGAVAPQPQPAPAPDGTDDGEQEGGENTPLELGLVMTWYKYGTLAKTLVCAPGETVGRRILRTQLAGDELEYDLSLYGDDAENAEITQVLCARENGQAHEAAVSGTLELSSGAETERFTFTIDARAERIAPDGTHTQEDLHFTVVLTIRSGLDLDLEMKWTQADGTQATLLCGADASCSRTLKASELPDGQLAYSLRLLGEAAEDAELLSASYTTASGAFSGVLDIPEGILSLLPPEGEDEEVFYLTITAGVGQQQLSYTLVLTCIQTPDLALHFNWYANGTERHELSCAPGESVSDAVKNSQLAAGGLLYDMALGGEDAKSARITDVRYTSEGGGEGTLSASGSLAMSLPADRTSASYTLLVTAALWQGGKQTQVQFTVRLRLSSDVCLEMHYTIYPDGAAEERLVNCENGKTQTAEAIFDDQLTDGLLAYRMVLSGADAQSMRITDVQCYQSGSGASVPLRAEGSVQLLSNGAKTGENTFTVTAQDDAGQVCRFTINIPYRPRGKNLVKIETNLTDGMTVTNETPVNLTVRAWSEDESGKLISNILASGTDTELRVTLDGAEVRCDSTSGTLQQYVLLPANPEKGDRNEHTLTIFATDAYGNYGELTLTLLGQRTQAGQKIGTAQIYIDLSVLGLGIRGPIRYSVLSEEPISYSIAKAIWGYDAGAVFGTADESFGWPSSSCSYSGTLDKGFYLTALGDGSGLGAQASALSGASWNALGAGETEVLAAIDAQFGPGSALASLWRCIYRNGIALGVAPGGDSVGEFDFTTGSGWMYTLGGTFFPGTAMSDYYLKDGDTLTLRYTLAYGWDIGGGSGSYGNSVGYCVSASGGSISVSHQYELVESGETQRYVCRCCGLEEQCPHEHTEWQDLGDGTCEQRCIDCGDPIAAPQTHDWQYQPDEGADTHTAVCKNCGTSEPQAHDWQPGEDSATCTEAGSIHSVCADCGAEKDEPTPPKGHNPENVWYHDGAVHWLLCSNCGEEVEDSRGEHTYVYNEAEGDWLCTGCGALHGWDGCGTNDTLQSVSSNCEELVWKCTSCGLTLRRSGTFEEYHNFENGVCTLCDAVDPAWKPQEPEPAPAPNPEPDPEPEPELPEQPEE